MESNDAKPGAAVALGIPPSPPDRLRRAVPRRLATRQGPALDAMLARVCPAAPTGTGLDVAGFQSAI